MRRLAFALAVAMPLAAQPLAAQDEQAAEAGPFDPNADAGVDLARALQAAAAGIISNDSGPDPYTQRVLAIFGANWCHDSRDLVAMLARPRVAELVASHYQVVLIDAGMPQTGNGRNLDLAQQHGVSDITGTPTVLVLDADGELLNSADNARSWRNASTRSEREIYRFLRQWAKPQD